MSSGRGGADYVIVICPTITVIFLKLLLKNGLVHYFLKEENKTHTKNFFFLIILFMGESRQLALRVV